MSPLYTCIRCHQEFPTKSFALRFNGERTLRCIDCLRKNGVIICEHNLITSLCTNCSMFCKHKREITECRFCSNPIPIIARTMVNNNLTRDKQKGMYDAKNCVNYEHVLELIQVAQGSCYYCKCSLQYQTYADNLGSLERLTNSLGHVKGNCVIACWKCNRTHVGEKIVRRPTKKRALQNETQPLTFFEMLEKISTSFPATQTSSLPVEEKKVPSKKRRLEEIELFL